MICYIAAIAAILGPATAHQNLLPAWSDSDVVESVSVSPDGQAVAISTWFGVVAVWHRKTGKVLWSASPDDGRLIHVAFSADGREIATGSWTGAVELWEPGTGKLLHRFAPFDEPGLCVAFAPDSGAVAIAGGRGATEGFIAEVGLDETAARVMYPHLPEPCRTIAFTPNGRYLVAGTGPLSDSINVHGRGDIHIFDREQRKLLKTIPGHGDGIFSLAVSPDGDFLACAGGGFVEMYRIRDWVRLWGVEPTATPRAVAFSPDSRVLAEGEVSGHINLRAVVSGRIVGEWGAAGGSAMSLAFDRSGRNLIVGGIAATEVVSLKRPRPRVLGTLVLFHSQSKTATSAAEWLTYVPGTYFISSPGIGSRIYWWQNGTPPVTDDEIRSMNIAERVAQSLQSDE